MEVNAQKTLKLLQEKNTRITELEEEVQRLKRRISDLEELLTQYDPDRDESHLDDNQR